MVKPKPVPVILPEIVFVPASAFILVAEPKVTAPAQEFVPDIKRNAPSEEIPVPESVKGFTPITAPCIWSAVPSETLTLPAVVPSAVAFWILITPALIVVFPV